MSEIDRTPYTAEQLDAMAYSELAAICGRCLAMGTESGCPRCGRVWKPHPNAVAYQPGYVRPARYRSRRLEPYAILLALWLPVGDVTGASQAIANYTVATQGAFA